MGEITEHEFPKVEIEKDKGETKTQKDVMQEKWTFTYVEMK